LARVISPNSSNSRYSHSSSMFQLKLPTNRFLDPLSSTAVSVLTFFVDSTGSSSALRFLLGASVSLSLSLESDASSSSSSLETDEAESSLSSPSSSDSSCDRC
jgi:hypothetical protein